MIVKGGGIRILKVLQRRFGGRNWRKMSGTALVRDVKGEIYEAEIHWFEAHGIGRKLVKVKRSHKGRQKG
ncbi:MAG: hypothetical protein ABSF29_04935 [Tepidisphaeraceae bacterium]